ncbi:hypothetical protein PQ459_13470 [Chryseobacterium sp. KACC 21268]|nr:hypothetical protein PQ459_13470 [Chryseobacterium sp. KACC 21268]
MFPQIDNKSEKFDLSKFDNSKKENQYVLRETLPDASYLEMVRLQESRFFLTSKNSYFTVVKIYHQNLNIKQKGLGFNTNPFSFKKGIWYEFDEQGNLIKEKDYDKNYQFNFEDVLEFCKKESIQVDKGPILQSTGYHTMISRNEDTEKSGAIWEIKWMKDNHIEEIIKLDGKTGKVLERREQKFINN